MASIELNIGRIITSDQKRDAIHIAVAPMQAAEKLFPGKDVGLTAEGKASATEKLVGIVDPFLRGPVFAEQWFWVFLYPNTVTSLRHEWTHPAFDTKPESLGTADEAREWLGVFAVHLGLSYDALMEAAEHYLSTGNVTVQQNSERWRDNFYGNEKDFWKRYETMTGTKVEDHDAVPFCCTC